MNTAVPLDITSHPEHLSVQDFYAPQLICFGCGPANDKGLQLKSFIVDGSLVADFTPQPHHQAFPGMTNGGVIAALVDCHMNWAATCGLMTAHGLAKPPCSVTAEFQVKYHAPTPSQHSLRLVAVVLETGKRSAKTSCEVFVDETLVVSATGVFVAVKEGHPAFHRW